MKKLRILDDEECLRLNCARGERFIATIDDGNGETSELPLTPNKDQPPASHDLLVGITDDGETVNIHLHEQQAIAIIGGGVAAE